VLSENYYGMTDHWTPMTTDRWSSLVHRDEHAARPDIFWSIRQCSTVRLEIIVLFTPGVPITCYILLI
jgi:hypothetical protein